MVGPSWDIVVLGRIDASFVSQWRPSPHVMYTQVLAGEVQSDQASGQLALVGLAVQLLPEGCIPRLQKSARGDMFSPESCGTWI